jgi:asparagine synthetase B (glutamine-hydrolysing)
MTEKSNIVINKKLIDEKAWKEYINNLKTEVETELTKEKSNPDKEKLRQALLNAIKTRCKGKFGILLSGGVDSSFIALVAKKLNCDFICYSVGVEGSPDVEFARKLADELDLELKYKILTEDELEEVIKLTVKTLNNSNVVKVGVGCVVYAAAELAKEDNINVLFSGLGSEEIFAGYDRHGLADDVNKECWIGLESMWERDFVRDFTLGKHFNVEIMTPFLDKELIIEAMKFPPEDKLDDDQKKIILRKIAEEEGLPNEFAWRKKKAAQYGSKFDKFLQKIAKKNGFKYKYQYLESLLL